MIELVDLFTELNNLKRLRASLGNPSLAEEQFRLAWSATAAIGNTLEVFNAVTANCLAQVKLCGISTSIMRGAGMSAADCEEVELRSFNASCSALDGYLRDQLVPYVGKTITGGPVPEFVDLLCSRPRAGATRPGHARLIVLPQESHAEHCLVVALYSVLLSPKYGADPKICFLASLSHHLHNAYLPDSGFAGEELLCEYLQPVVQSLQQRALTQLKQEFAYQVSASLSRVADLSTPEGCAFHAADVLDRVLQMKWHEESSKFTLSAALNEMELVHAGPLREFQMEVLREARLC